MNRFRPGLLLAAVSLTCVALAGCGKSTSSPTASAATGSASGSSSSSGINASTMAELKSAIAAAEAVPKWQASGPAFDARNLAGKSVFCLCTPANQFGESFIAGVTAAAKAVGMKVATGGSSTGLTSQNVQALQGAVNAHYSVIVIEALDPTSLGAGLVNAKSEGIPVIESFIGDPALPSSAAQALGVYANGTYCYSCTGQLAAEWEIVKTGGKIKSVVQQFNGMPPSDATAKGWDETLSKYCPQTCTVSNDNITFGAQTVQQIQSGTQVAAQDSSVNTIFPVYDYQMAYMLPELQAANASGRIDLLSENADLAQMQEMKQGTSVKVDVGNPVAWDGWATMDEALRALEKLPPVVDEKLPLRLFDINNVATIDLSANPASWYGGAEYALDYEKLWGVAS